jgi:hypothetical protein
VPLVIGPGIASVLAILHLHHVNLRQVILHLLKVLARLAVNSLYYILYFRGT